ncbi:ATP-binding protein [Candidatus Woesearchaeota archaeon]|nr:ATP-binding protein [Candidatus Woesearchaeota archaeon]
MVDDNKKKGPGEDNSEDNTDKYFQRGKIEPKIDFIFMGPDGKAPGANPDLMKSLKDQLSAAYNRPRPPPPVYTREQTIAPLDEIFIDELLKDEIVTRTGIPELLEGKTPVHNGVILHGPPGTGKTVLLKALRDVYTRSGAYARDVSISSINMPMVGMFAHLLEEHILAALDEAELRKKPSFLTFDEASTIAQDSAGMNHYQEAIDVLKRYLGNNRNIVLAISTNEAPDTFEEALVREGRLTAFLIDYPGINERAKMWKYFAQKYEVLKLKDDQALVLAQATPEEQGAFIEEFCRGYVTSVRNKLFKDLGHTTLVQALRKQAKVSDTSVRKAIKFDKLTEDLEFALQRKKARNYKKGEIRGFQ